MNAAFLGCREFNAARAAAIEFFCAGKNQRVIVEYQTIGQLYGINSMPTDPLTMPSL